MAQIKVPFSEKGIEIVANEYAGRVTNVRFLGSNGDFFYEIECEIPLILRVVDGSSTNREQLMEQLVNQNDAHMDCQEIPLPIADKYGEFILQLNKGEQHFYVLAYMVDNADYWKENFVPFVRM